ncbi:hypothetical protein HGRIS_008366 [Hohenbuehelia grisea]|uniref:CSC1/OSCA1-like 7TM region domain-containing protein n=1 Tax=Hohenbuehelia grisea TaxID=104357 RepID=A0ABR3J870_9AGAR
MTNSNPTSSRRSHRRRSPQVDLHYVDSTPVASSSTVQNNWWTTSGGSTFLPSGPNPDTKTNTNANTNTNPNANSDTNTNSPTNANSNTGAAGTGAPSTTVLTVTSSVPVATVTDESTTFTSFSESLITTTSIFGASSGLSSLSSPTSSPSPSPSALSANDPAVSGTPQGKFAAQSQPVCLGDGVDAYSEGLIASVIVPSVIGLIIWAIFAVLRPRFRQVYGLREWFVEPETRPKPLGSSFFSFLFPHVPLVPSLPSSAPDSRRDTSDDRNPSPSPSTNLANVFPSDEALAQRTLWLCLMIVLGWSIIGLAGALPLYLVKTPCLADASSDTQSSFGGAYSALQDLSLLRLLRLLDDGNITTMGNLNTRNLHSRMVVDGHDYAPQARTRLIIIVVLTLVVALLPALYKILKEFNNLVAYRRTWVDERCEGVDMGWISARRAPGFAGWGEKRIKDFLVKSGLSAGGVGGLRRTGTEATRGSRMQLDRNVEGENGNENSSHNGSGYGPYGGRRRKEEQPLTNVEDGDFEVDVQNLFSISDTQFLSKLIDERDEILDTLEIAETRYISSFTLTTPDPSVLDFEPALVPQADDRPYISRPLPLGGPAKKRTRRGRRANPAFGSSSLAPTSFIGPSAYYRLRGVHGISGGRFGGSEYSYPRSEDASLSQSINSRIVGARFQEINRNSAAYGRLPLGSPVGVSEKGELGGGGPPATSGWASGSEQGAGTMSVGSGNIAGIGGGMGVGGMGGMLDRLHTMDRGSRLDMFTIEEAETPIPDPRRYGPNHAGHSDDETPLGDGEEWVDLNDYVDYEELEQVAANEAQSSTSPLPIPRRRPKKAPISASRRETFPLRQKEAEAGAGSDTDDVPPPHLRLQPSQPFVRPLSGLNFDGLGEVYGEIRHWRSRLKAINLEIADAQNELYLDIADGVRVKGWLLIGRGLRHLPGVELIEGRAKEDVRWDVLQNESDGFNRLVWWAVMIVTAVLLAAGLTAASGLALATAPDVAHYLPFLDGLLSTDPLAAGIATVLAPAVAATVFVGIALWIVRRSTFLRPPISVSGGQLLTFKASFYILTAVASIWLVTVGALLFSFQSFNQDGFNDSARSQSVANGSVYMSVLALAIILNVAIIVPGILMLQPIRLWRVRRAEKQSLTPRQRFRAVYPRTYDPSFATAASILAIVFACTFSIIFPLIGPAVVLLLLLTLIAHRYLVGYVYGRTHSSTGGLLQIWMIRRFGSLLSLQPFLLGLILLSRKEYILGGVCCGVGLAVVIFVESYTSWKTRAPPRSSLKPITQDSLDHFEEVIKMMQLPIMDEEGVSLVGSARSPRRGGSMASVLEMMSLTLAVMPSPSTNRGSVPLGEWILCSISV